MSQQFTKPDTNEVLRRARVLISNYDLNEMADHLTLHREVIERCLNILDVEEIHYRLRQLMGGALRP